MTKNQQVLLGVAAVGIVGYLYWKSKQPKAAFVTAGANGMKKMNMANVAGKKMNTNGVQKLAGPVANPGAKGAFKAGFAKGNVAPQKDSKLTANAAGANQPSMSHFQVKSTNW